jgi:hypothetical protein
MLGLPPVFVLTRTALLTLLVGFASTAVAATAPSVTLLAPGNGTLVEGAPTFRWPIDSPHPVAGTVTVTHRVATDIALTQNVTTTSRSCPAQNLNCWTSFALVRTSRGPQYWQVSVTGALTATSRTWMFQRVAPRLEPDRQRPRALAYRARRHAAGRPCSSHASRTTAGRLGCGSTCFTGTSSSSVR